jgi:hypothetical protein
MIPAPVFAEANHEACLYASTWLEEACVRHLGGLRPSDRVEALAGERFAMRVSEVEILSDETNAAIMRHPGRAYPGVLVQGDSLHNLCTKADRTCSFLVKSSPAFEEMNEVRNALWTYLNHYKVTLTENKISFPFNE